MSKKWVTVLVTVLVVMVVGVAVGLLYIYSGSYNVAADDDVEGLTRWVFSTTTMESIQARAEPVQLDVSDEVIREGAREYHEMCVMCHGAPGHEENWLMKGMTPEPPDLEHAAEELSTGELYWILEHGIKHTGMPALGPTHGEEEIRTIVAFVERLPDLSKEEYEQLTQGASEGEHAHGEGAEGETNEMAAEHGAAEHGE